MASGEKLGEEDATRPAGIPLHSMLTAAGDDEGPLGTGACDQISTRGKERQF